MKKYIRTDNRVLDTDYIKCSVSIKNKTVKFNIEGIEYTEKIVKQSDNLVKICDYFEVENRKGECCIFALFKDALEWYTLGYRFGDVGLYGVIDENRVVKYWDEGKELVLL